MARGIFHCFSISENVKSPAPRCRGAFSVYRHECVWEDAPDGKCAGPADRAWTPPAPAATAHHIPAMASPSAAPHEPVRSGPLRLISRQPRRQGPHKAASSCSSRCRLAAPTCAESKIAPDRRDFKASGGPKRQFVMWAVWTAWLNIAFSESVISCGVFAV